MFNKKTISSLSGAALLAAFALPASAVVPGDAVMFQHWEFNETQGTGLSAVANSVAGGSSFNWDIDNSRTSGNGTFIVNRLDTANQISFAEMNNLPSSGKIWLVHDIVSWDYGTSEVPRFRVGFFDNIDSATQGSNNVGELTVGADHRPDSGLGGFAVGGEHVGYTDLGFAAASTESTAPIRIVTEYDQDNHSYEIFYSYDFNDANPTYTSIGSDITDGSKVAGFLGISTINNFPNDGLELDQVYVAAIPEPSTYALFAGLGILGLAVWRRSRKSAA